MLAARNMGCASRDRDEREKGEKGKKKGTLKLSCILEVFTLPPNSLLGTDKGKKKGKRGGKGKA